MGAGASLQAEESPATVFTRRVSQSHALEFNAAQKLWDTDTESMEDYMVVFKWWNMQLGMTLGNNEQRSSQCQAMVTNHRDAAKEHGIRLGSVITSVNGQSAAGMTLKQVVDLIGDTDWPKTLKLRGPAVAKMQEALIAVPMAGDGTEELETIGMDFGLIGETVSVVPSPADSPELEKVLSLWDQPTQTAVEECTVVFGVEDRSRLGITYRDNAAG
jgi:hypothetical protein